MAASTSFARRALLLVATLHLLFCGVFAKPLFFKPGSFSFSDIFSGGSSFFPNLAPALSNNTFDYIVVGGGTGGITTASRLSEDGKSSVLLIEAGKNIDYSFFPREFSQTPGGDVIGVGADSGTDSVQNNIDWLIQTVPQRGANNRQMRYAAGKVTGGSSARNFMLYQRPTVGTMNKWVELTGDSSWSFANTLRLFKKSMTFTPPRSDLRRVTPEVQFVASDYGSSSSIAPLQVTYPNFAQNFSSAMQRSLNEVGVPTSNSFNNGVLNGVSFAALTISPGKNRRSTSHTFLDVAKDRKNFKAYYSTYAKRILFSKPTDGSQPKATAVTISTLPNGFGTTNIVYARKEIIVSAGAFMSPQLLMVSGIGPQAQLSNNGITPVYVNENVGQGLQDHLFFGPTYKVAPGTNTLTDVAADPIYLAGQFLNFTANGLGPLANNVADMLAWERINAKTLTAIGAPALNAYPTDWPIFEALSAPGAVGNFDNLLQLNAAMGKDGSRFATILMALVAPLSRGTVTLSSADMKDRPVVDPAWLTDPQDQKVAIFAFKRARQYFAAKAMASTLFNGDAQTAEALPGFASVNTDDEILNWIRDNLMTVWHASCTCAMKKQELGGVLDNKLQVYGVQGLRVVDASAFPMLPPGHPQSTIYMLAERAAELILAARG